MPARKKIAAVEHHAALPWQQIGAFMAELRERAGTAALALEFTVLTAARTRRDAGCALDRDRLDRGGVDGPGHPHENRAEHRVPLTDAALAVSRQAAEMHRNAADAYVFPGSAPARPSRRWR